jgi:steroid 5-alpha reductase family enzyme
MVVAARTVLGAVALLVVAPVGAAVIIATLLLFGVDPHWVFLPGRAVQSTLQAFGFHVANRVAVLTTVVVWWGIIVSVWLALRRLWRVNGREHR